MKKIKINNIRIFVISSLLLLLLLGTLTSIAYFIIISYLPNIKFGHPQWVWLLALPLVIFGAFVIVIIRKNHFFNRFTNIPLEHYAVSNLSSSKDILKKLLLIAGFFFLALAIINPRIGNKKEHVKSKGLDVMIALDVSNSMLAEDIKPNRLERAKQSILNLIDNLHGDRIGIIVFAGEAYVQLPLTNDYSAANLFIDYITPDIVPVQGTAIGKAINLALDSFDPNSKSGKTIVVITDGENHEDDVAAASKQALDSNVVVNFIGLGSSKGEPIPIYKNGRQVDYKRDENGNVVITRLDEATLVKAAEAGGGAFVKGSSASLKLDQIINDMRSHSSEEKDNFIYTDFEDRFQIFLIIALLCFISQILITPARKTV